jgi:hypothetical protein
MNRQASKPIRILIVFFVLVNAVAIAGKHLLAKYSIDPEVVIIGNLILFAVSLLAFFISVQATKSSSSQAFIRAMYASFMIKFFIVVIAAFIYIMIAKKDVSRGGLAVCAILYIIYTVMETKALTRALRSKSHA